MSKRKTYQGRKGDRSGNRKKRRYTAPKKKTPRYNIRTGGFIGMNVKYADSWNTGTALTAPTGATGGEIGGTIAGTGAVSQLVGISQGTGESQRIGNEVRYSSLYLTGNVSCASQVDQTALDVGTKVFLALVLDTQTNGAQLNSEDVYSNPSATALLAANPIRNMEQSKRFKVLKTWRHSFEPPAVSYDGANIEQGGLTWDFECFLDMDIPQQHKLVAATGVVSDVVDNSFHLIGFTNSTQLAPTVYYNCRARYVDA